MKGLQSIRMKCRLLWCWLLVMSRQSVSAYTVMPPTTRVRCIISRPSWGIQSNIETDVPLKQINRWLTITTCQMSTKSDSSSQKDNAEEPLTPERVAELIEVSFVNGIIQLSQGYVDVLKLLVAAIQAGYALGMTPGNLLDTVAECPELTANRPLMDEEAELRTTWIQIVYLVLDHVTYKDKHLGDLDLTNHRDNGSGDAIDDAVRDTYSGAIPTIEKAKEDGASFEAEKILELCRSVLPNTDDSRNSRETILLSQNLRVMWLTFTALEEEAQCLEDKAPYKPRPQIPGAFED